MTMSEGPYDANDESRGAELEYEPETPDFDPSDYELDRMWWIS